jgi:hypothetical protein
MMTLILWIENKISSGSRLLGEWSKVNSDKPKYMVMSVDQNAGRSQYVKFDDCSDMRVQAK